MSDSGGTLAQVRYKFSGYWQDYSPGTATWVADESILCSRSHESGFHKTPGGLLRLSPTGYFMTLNFQSSSAIYSEGDWLRWYYYYASSGLGTWYQNTDIPSVDWVYYGVGLPSDHRL